MLMYLNQTYDPDLNCRFQAGPQVCTAVVKEMYGLAEVVNMQIESSGLRWIFNSDYHC